MTDDTPLRYAYGSEAKRFLIALGVAWLLFACFGLLIFFLESASPAEFRRSAVGVLITLLIVELSLAAGVSFATRFCIELSATTLCIHGLLGQKTIQLSTIKDIEVVDGIYNRPAVLRDNHGRVLARISSIIEGQESLVGALRYRLLESKA